MGDWKLGGQKSSSSLSGGRRGGSEGVKVNNGKGGRYGIDQGCGKKVYARRVTASWDEGNESSSFEKGHALGEYAGLSKGYEQRCLGLSSGGKSG